MAAKTYNYTESNSESSHSGDTNYQTKGSPLSFTAPQDSEWLVVGTWLQSNSDVSGPDVTIVKMVDGSTFGDDRGLTQEFMDPDYSDGWQTGMAVQRITASDTSASDITLEYDLFYKTTDAGSTAYIKNARIVAIKLGDNDSIAGTDALGTTTSTTYQDRVTHTVDITGDYLVLGGATIVGTSTSYSSYAQLEIDGNGHAEMIREPEDGGNAYSYFAAKKYTFTTGNRDIKIRYKAGNALQTTGIWQAFIAVFKLSDFPDYAYNEAVARTTTDQDTYQTALTLTDAPTNSAHWILATAIHDNDSISGDTQIRNTIDAVTDAELMRGPKDTTDRQAFFSSKVETLSSSSTDFDIDFLTDAIFGDAGISDMTFTILQLGEPDANFVKANVKHTYGANYVSETMNGYSWTTTGWTELFGNWSGGAEDTTWWVYNQGADENFLYKSGVLTSDAITVRTKVKMLTSSGQMILAPRGNSGSDVNQTINILWDKGGSIDNIRLRDGSTTKANGSLSLAPTQNQWYTLTVILTRSTCQVYIDGVLHIDHDNGENYSNWGNYVDFGLWGGAVADTSGWEFDYLYIDDATTINTTLANILQAGTTQANFVKANLFFLQTQANSVVANIANIPTRANFVKASLYQILSKNNEVKAFIVFVQEKANEVKSNIYFLGEQANAVVANLEGSFQVQNKLVANILRVGKTQNSSSKANIALLNQTYSSSVKAFIAAVEDNLAMANIIGHISQDNAVKANLGSEVNTANVIANIKRKIFNKRYEYRVYSANPTYITTWSEEVISQPSFRSVINGGSGEMVIRLARSFDNFGEDTDVKLANRVECWCFDVDAPSGTLVYSGYISGYRPVLEGHSEFVEVTLLPLLARMARITYRNANGDTTITHSSAEPADIIKDIIDKHRVDGGELIYTASSIDDTGTTVSYTYKIYSAKEAMDKAIQLTPINWYWRADPDNTVHLHLSDLNIATHKFFIGKHISTMETWRRTEDLVNTVYFVGQETAGVPMYRYYVNNGSVTSYGIHAVKLVDQRVTITATADQLSNRLINTKKDPEIRTTVKISDNNGSDPNKGYDIESIKPGQTMSIKNIKQAIKTVSRWDVAQWDADIWDQTLSYSAADVIQILSVEYHPDYVIVEASSRLPEIPKRVEDINRNQEESTTWNVPTSPTVA